jgi:hypothetical protein
VAFALLLDGSIARTPVGMHNWLGLRSWKELSLHCGYFRKYWQRIKDRLAADQLESAGMIVLIRTFFVCHCNWRSKEDCRGGVKPYAEIKIDLSAAPSLA